MPSVKWMKCFWGWFIAKVCHSVIVAAMSPWHWRRWRRKRISQQLSRCCLAASTDWVQHVGQRLTDCWVHLSWAIKLGVCPTTGWNKTNGDWKRKVWRTFLSPDLNRKLYVSFPHFCTMIAAMIIYLYVIERCCEKILYGSHECVAMIFKVLIRYQCCILPRWKNWNLTGCLIRSESAPIQRIGPVHP